MRLFNIKDFANGWFIGDFEPTLLKTDIFEVAHHKYSKGYVGEPHVHRIAKEFNYIVAGRVRVGGSELKDGDGFIFSQNEYEKVEFLEDTDLIIIKSPSVKGDKWTV